jgi:hypothetical protein
MLNVGVKSEKRRDCPILRVMVMPPSLNVGGKRLNSREKMTGCGG